MNNSSIAVGLASFGMSGRLFHAPFIDKHPSLILKSIFERTKSDSQEKYPNSTIVRSFDDILNDQEIELVVVNTPTYLHYEMTKAALLAGKHVVVEKPFTSHVKEAEELIELAENKKLILTVYHNKRLESGFKTVEKLLHSNQLGEIYYFKNAFHRYRPEIGLKAWKENDLPGAGLLYDIGSHLIDQTLVLFGWPVGLDVDLQIQRPESKVNDYFLIKFLYKNLTVEITSDFFTKGHKPTYKIEGSEASFTKYGIDQQENKLKADTIDWDQLGKDPVENHGYINPTNSQEKIVFNTERGSYTDFYDNVFNAIRKGEKLLIEPKEALDVIKIIEWAEEISLVNQP